MPIGRDHRSLQAGNERPPYDSDGRCERNLSGYQKVGQPGKAKAGNSEDKAWQRKQMAFNAVNPVLGDVDLRAISPSLLHSYTRRRNGQGVSNATINRELAAIKHLLACAVECGVIEVNPMERFRLLREEKKDRPRFTENQVWSLINAVRPDCRRIFVFISENTKSRKYRYVPLTDLAIESVKALPKLDGCL